jgi:hypothetical protein
LHGISTGKACAHSPRCLWRICSKLLMSQLHHCSQLAAIRRHSGARLVLACCQSLRSNQMFVVGLWQLRSLYWTKLLKYGCVYATTAPSGR